MPADHIRLMEWIFYVSSVFRFGTVTRNTDS